MQEYFVGVILPIFNASVEWSTDYCITELQTDAGISWPDHFYPVYNPCGAGRLRLLSPHSWAKPTAQTHNMRSGSNSPQLSGRCEFSNSMMISRQWPQACRLSLTSYAQGQPDVIVVLWYANGVGFIIMIGWIAHPAIWLCGELPWCLLQNVY